MQLIRSIASHQSSCLLHLCSWLEVLPHIILSTSPLQLIRSIASHLSSCLLHLCSWLEVLPHIILSTSPCWVCQWKLYNLVLLFLVSLPWEEEFEGGTDGAPAMKATDFHEVFYFWYMSVTVLVIKMARRQKVLCLFHTMRRYSNLQMRFSIFILFYFIFLEKLLVIFILVLCVYITYIFIEYTFMHNTINNLQWLLVSAFCSGHHHTKHNLKLKKNHTIVCKNGKRSHFLDINWIELLKHYEVHETNLSFIHSLYSINPSLGTDTTGFGTCQNSIYSIAEHNHFTLHIDIDTYNVSGSGRYLYH